MKKICLVSENTVGVFKDSFTFYTLLLVTVDSRKLQIVRLQLPVPLLYELISHVHGEILSIGLTVKSFSKVYHP